MGKSDHIIFQEYLKVISSIGSNFESVAFLGFPNENIFTNSIRSNCKHFYDIQLGNWNINEDWSLKQKYDLIVCTRCAYFSKNPKEFIDKCKSHLKQDGSALIDWGLGDHWRFEKYKVGWIRDGEHEYAYSPNNFLYSCFWNDDLLTDEQVNLFWTCVKKNQSFNYSSNSLDDVVRREVPSIIDYSCKKIKTKFLWPEKPQLYIITLV